MVEEMQPGNIVHFRERDWLLLPSDEDTVYRLRPLIGATDEVIAVHKGLTKYTLPEEHIAPTQFPPPSAEDVSDTAGAHLLWHAARLILREGASPLRSLGRISIRPRTYQFVPLLMALRLDPVRLLIADDVGVGKTIEALLVARELFDRGEIRRLAVLCPPYLCDQWEREMREKFNFEAVVIGSGTISRLERNKPVNRSLYEHYPFQVVSIDWVKSERNKHQFLQFCPELVIVDEAHGAVEPVTHKKSQQQRHQLLKEIADKTNRHLILLTATPHSGIDTAFRSLLGLLRLEFREWDIGSLAEAHRIELAKYFVQRTRRDIELDWEGKHCFPERISVDETYALSERYRQLFDQTYNFCSELVRTGDQLEERKRRVRYWGALALMRCVMSSPAAAIAALEQRAGRIGYDEEEPDLEALVFEASDEYTDDETPVSPIEEAEASLLDTERLRLRALERLARKIFRSGEDTKLRRCQEVIKKLLKEGFHPIVWCRYVATAEYVGEGLRDALGSEAQVTVITGRMGDEERRIRIDQIDPYRPHVLVATDCLSEGINLQEKFTAVLHYDLPWNPNRLEQREGRVDRYGQTARKVKAIRFYGRDNPVDGAVIEVLLNKAREIHRVLGTYVPVPEESETVMQAVFHSLFVRRSSGRQLALFNDNKALQQFHEHWDRDTERERINRTRFAQRTLKPDEVRRELEAVDAVLGDPHAVQEFVLNAAQRIGLSIHADRRNPEVFCVDLSTQATATLPDIIRLELLKNNQDEWRISFVSPTPDGAEYIGRNHRFVASLAQYLLEDALTRGSDAVASRCGVLRTRAVQLLTTLLLLRVRYLVHIPERAPLLSEEVLVMGYQASETADNPWLSGEEALRLLSEAKPDANIPAAEKRELVQTVLEELDEWSWSKENHIQEAVVQRILERARDLETSHKRIRKAVSLRVKELKVEPQLPPDLLGILVLQPMVNA